jgi:hypothetical protein
MSMVGCKWQKNPLRIKICGRLGNSGRHMFRKSLGAATTVYCLLIGAADSESTIRECQGDYRKPVYEEPYNFLMTSQVVWYSDYKMVVTCIQNTASGYFRWRWHIPGHSASFNKPDTNHQYRPVGMYAGLNPAQGCYIYGNLNLTGRAYFHADPDQIGLLDRERIACPTKFGEADFAVGEGSILGQSLSVPMLAHLAQLENRAEEKVIPKLIRYQQENTFFVDDSEIDRDIARLKLNIFFQGSEKEGVLGVTYSFINIPKSLDLTKSQLWLKPIGDTMAAVALKKAFSTQIGEKYLVGSSGKVKIVYENPNKKEFNSAQIGIYNDKNEIITSLWVPVLY